MKQYFSKFELALWGGSVATIIIVTLAMGQVDVLTLVASVIGATFLILNAKGNVWGQVLTVIFSIMYGIISFKEAYYGEMVTYLGMTAPIAAISVVTWLKHPAQKGKNEVKVNHIKPKEYMFLALLTTVVTIAFYFILGAFNTAVLWLSTISVATSFLASYLTMRRNEFFALAYAANDVVLIGLWVIASLEDFRNVSMVICFCVFLINDLYGFISWSRMKTRQHMATHL